MGPIWDAELRVWDAKNFGLVSPGTHRNKFVKKSLPMFNFLGFPFFGTVHFWYSNENVFDFKVAQDEIGRKI